MSTRNGSAGDVEIDLPANLSLPDGTVIGSGQSLALMLDAAADPNARPGAPYTFESVLSAASAQTPIAERLTTRVTQGFRRGMGLDYNAAYGLYTRDGYAMPAGAASPVGLGGTGLTHATTSPIVAFAELLGVLFVAQQGLASGNGGRVVKLVGGVSPAVEDLFLPPGDFIRDLLVADDGSGHAALFATSESATHTNGRLHMLSTVTGVWTSTTAGVEFAAARGLGRMAYEFMQPDTSPGDYRIVCLTGPKTFAYTLPNVNPQGSLGTAGSATANWSPDIKVGTRGQLVDIAAARRHFWLAATDNLFDVDELGASSGVTSFLPQMQQAGNGSAVLYMDGYVYMSVGRGLIRLRVDQGTVLIERPQQCAPGWGTKAENDVRGYVTAMCPDQGGFFTATYNPSVQKSYICWNTVRDFDTDQSRNPLVAHGPEVMIDTAFQVTRMLTSGLAGDLRLWIGSISVPGNNPRLDWVSLPIAGSPLQDLVSGGPMKFTTGAPGNIVQPYARLETLLDDWDDGGAANVMLYQDTLITRGLSVHRQPDNTTVDDGVGTKLTIASRADPQPGSTSWGAPQDVTVSPAQDVAASPPPDATHSAVYGAHRTQLQISFLSPQGGASPPKVGVLDAIRRLGWKEVPSLPTFTLHVTYGDGVSVPFGQDPDRTTALLKAVSEGPKTTLTTLQGRRYTVKLDQVLDIREEWRLGGDWGRTVHATLQGSILAAL